MSRLLHHASSLSSLKRKGKSDASPKSDSGGWNKSRNPLEKLMQQARDSPSESESEDVTAEESCPPLSAAAESDLTEDITKTEACDSAEGTITKGVSLGPHLGQKVEDGAGEEEAKKREKSPRKGSKKSSKKNKKKAAKKEEADKGKGPRDRVLSEESSLDAEAALADLAPADVAATSGTPAVQGSEVGDTEGAEVDAERSQSADEDRTHESVEEQSSDGGKEERATDMEKQVGGSEANENEEADELLERTIRIVRSLSQYKFKRGASMDDILAEISSDDDGGRGGRSRREQSELDCPSRSESPIATQPRVTKNMTSLANQMTLPTKEKGVEKVDEKADEGEAAGKEALKDARAKRRSARKERAAAKKQSAAEDTTEARKLALSTSATLSKKKTPNSSDTPILKRLGSVLLRATRVASNEVTESEPDSPEEMTKFYQQKLKATTEVLERVHAAEMVAKRRYRQLQRTERELLKKCERVGAGEGKYSKKSPRKDLEVQTQSCEISTEDVAVCQQIGRGASGTIVYKCIVDGFACAMKELTDHSGPAGMSNDEEKDAFEKEMAYLCQLPYHKNIVKYLFHKKVKGQYCLFMTLYDGTLRNEIDRRAEKEGGWFTLLQVYSIALKVAAGIAFLHRNSILHRDLKGDNIFVRYNMAGDIDQCAIGDFDSAFRVGHSLRPDLCVGSPGFMAPEVMRADSSNTYSFEADVYSFGMLLYEVVALKFPYHEAKSPIMITKSVLAGEPPSITPGVYAMFEPIVDLHRRCIAHDRRQRPTMDEVVKELDGKFAELCIIESNGRNSRSRTFSGL